MSVFLSVAVNGRNPVSMKFRPSPKQMGLAGYELTSPLVEFHGFRNASHIHFHPFFAMGFSIEGPCPCKAQQQKISFLELTIAHVHLELFNDHFLGTFGPIFAEPEADQIL